MVEERCEYCKKKLTADNCTCVTSICDDCLADLAADARVNEMECVDTVFLTINSSEEE